MRLKELEDWLNPTDVSRMAEVSRQAVNNWLAEGKIRAVYTRAGWLVDPVDVKRFLNERGKKIESNT